VFKQPPRSLTIQPEIHLQLLLKLIEQNPVWTQRQVAKVLGVSLGKKNYCLKALKVKGWVKWGNFSQNPDKLSYMHLLTLEEIAQKLCLTAHFLRRKEAEQNRHRAEIHELRQKLGAHHRAVTQKLMANEREPAQLEN
jgi:EPS-associated MarR family transcriptional regulator